MGDTDNKLITNIVLSCRYSSYQVISKVGINMSATENRLITCIAQYYRDTSYENDIKGWY